MPVLNGKRMFPCPICTGAREVRITKKDKPYIVCDPCGVQLFIRGTAGIETFNQLSASADSSDLWARLKEMDRRYYLKFPKCGLPFWIEPHLAKTSMFDGTLQGFRCPDKKCGATVTWQKK